MVAALLFGSTASSKTDDQIWRAFQVEYCKKETELVAVCESSSTFSEFELKLKKVVNDCNAQAGRHMIKRNSKVIVDFGSCTLKGDSMKELYKAFFSGAKANECASGSSSLQPQAPAR